MPRIACIILNYNDYKTTEILVNHIKDYNSIDNIIIVDNCSTNDSFDRLQKYNSNKIKIIKTPMNNGYGAGNNFGLLYSRDQLGCDIAIIANPDVLFSELFVSECAEFIVNNSDVAIATGVMLNADNNIVQENVWKLPSAFMEVVDASSILKRLLSSSKYESNELLSNSNYEYVDVVSGSLFVVDSSKFIEVGLFDEDIFLYGEEDIIAIKMKKFGYYSVRLKSINYNHFHSTSINTEFKKMFSRRKLMVKSKKIILRKYYSLTKWKLFLLLLLLDLSLAEAAVIEMFKKVILKENK